MICHHFAVGESHEVPDRALNARMRLAIPVSTDYCAPQGLRIPRAGNPDMTDRSGTGDIAQGNRFARIYRFCRGAFTALTERARGLPPSPLAPVGFSNEIERDWSPVFKSYGS